MYLSVSCTHRRHAPLGPYTCFLLWYRIPSSHLGPRGYFREASATLQGRKERSPRVSWKSHASLRFPISICLFHVREKISEV